MKKKDYLMFLLMTASAVMSCTEQEPFPKNEVDETVLECQLDVSGINTVSTRSASYEQDCQVASVTALVFDSGDKFAYAASTTLDSSGKKLKVKLRQSTSSTDNYSVMIVANATASLSEGEAKADVWSKLIFASNGKVEITAKGIPMWGEVDGLNAKPGVTTTVKLMRALARIDIGMNFSNTTNGQEAVSGLTDGKGNAYTLSEIYLYRTRTSGCIVPNSSNLTNLGVPKAPTLPTTPVAGTYGEAISYTPEGNMSVRDIYLAENAADGASNNPTTLVVGITYQGTLSYYRVDITKDQKTARLPILRNFRYLFNIVSVIGTGYDTKEKALASTAGNLKWTLTVDDLENTGTYVSGDYYFEMNYSVLVPGSLGQSTILPFKTNIPDFAEKYMAFKEETANVTFKITKQTTPDANGVYTGEITFTSTTPNNGDAPLHYTLQVTFPPLDLFTVDVTQDIGRLQYDITNVQVNGIYLPIMNLGGTTTKYELIGGVHTMTVTLRSKIDYTGKAYTITTNKVNDYSFSAEGNLPAPDRTESGYYYYTVTLQGEGTPAASGFNFFMLTTDGMTIADVNTPSTYKDVRVLVGYNTKRILTYSYYQGTYGYSAESGAPNVFLTKGGNFGLNNCVVPIQDLPRTAIPTSYVYDYALPATFYNGLAATPKPDIVILGFEFNFDSGGGTTLANFIKNGGVVILFCNNNHATSNITNFVQKVTGGTLGYTQAQAYYGIGGTYNFPAKNGSYATQAPAANDPVLSGPFGSLWGKAWGQDWDDSAGVTGLGSSAIVYSRKGSDYTAGNYASMFRQGGLFFVGDGGFIAQYYHQDGGATQPFAIDNNGKAIPKTDYEPDVYNSAAFGNILYWAIDYLEFRNQTGYSAWGK
ncbi:MAG: hypothetical protein LBM06_09290 [Prevotellaceae bacterium]|jgi:hypothetical protein|nr:hypothetical protein [Prevotellaceae bacterium]